MMYTLVFSQSLVLSQFSLTVIRNHEIQPGHCHLMGVVNKHATVTLDSRHMVSPGFKC